MGHLLSSLSFLLILIATNYAAELTGLDYWNSVLPKTPMPNAITELLDLGNPNHRKHPHFAHAGLGKPTVSCLKYGPDCGSPPSEDQLQSDRNLPMFFLEKDLNPGKTMNLHFTRTMSTASNFIPRSEADKLPFSSSKFSEILNNFKVAKDSPQADVIKQTLQDCEEPAIRGEKQYCATSLESMVDFATSSLKTYNVRAMSTNVNSRNAKII
ncbi:hypothetical protein LUZ60_010676 [Juncus effusus]|nr:hypothetical protein LUZ60_010676 [Juncus effusus]